ncbi:MAG: M28 family peptidase [Pirellulaceae bacterium]
MQLVYPEKAKPLVVDPRLSQVADVSVEWLRRIVERISVPRHFVQQPETNEAIGHWLEEQFRTFGYQTRFQGPHRNLMTVPLETKRPVILVGAHYDSVPNTPGADDNASAVAAMLACAKAVSQYAPRAPVCFVAFNREEEELTGSKDFVADYLPTSGMEIQAAHVLEMVGYADDSPGSQRLPAGLPIRVTDRADFLAILGNRRSTHLVDDVMSCTKSYLAGFPVIGLKIYLGLENRIRHFRRSDHAPFWAARIPALMWTDTSEFRNANYHQPTDTPETLDYEFLARVARLLTVCVLTQLDKDNQ